MDERWINDLIDIQISKNNTFKRGELTKVFNSLGEKHNVSATKIKNYFYRVLKNGPPEDNVSENKRAEDKQTFTFNVKYPHFKTWIHSYTGDEGSDEWIDLNDFLNALTFPGPFEDFLNTQSLSNYKKFFKNEQDHSVEVILKKHLFKLMNSFNVISSSTKTKSELVKLEGLLKSDKISLEHATTDKIYYEIKVGELMDVTVEKILDYGVIVKLNAHERITGLVHISSIKDGFVENIFDYFTEGETIRARVTDKRGENWRLSFSVVGLLKRTQENTEDTRKFTLETSISPDEVSSLKELSESIRTKEPVPVIESVDKPVRTTSSILENEGKAIEQYIKTIVGPLSPNAKEKLVRLVEDYGLFKFSIGINEASKEFQSDLGLLLLEKVENDLRDGL